VSFVRRSRVIFVMLLGGCASSPPHYYTLLRESEGGAQGGLSTPVQVEVGRLPGQVDRLELVVRLPDGGIAIADGERWIAPVAEELQHALSAELSLRLGSVFTSQTARPTSVSVRLNVERFESSPSRYALIEASWRLEVKTVSRDVLVRCRTRAYEKVSGGYAELVKGHQRAIALIAEQITWVARRSIGDSVAECPAAGS
jgi:uncharacterized protein